jgi:hypothetical protein
MIQMGDSEVDKYMMSILTKKQYAEFRDKTSSRPCLQHSRPGRLPSVINRVKAFPWGCSVQHCLGQPLMGLLRSYERSQNYNTPFAPAVQKIYGHLVSHDMLKRISDSPHTIAIMAYFESPSNSGKRVWDFDKWIEPVVYVTFLNDGDDVHEIAIRVVKWSGHGSVPDDMYSDYELSQLCDGNTPQFSEQTMNTSPGTGFRVVCIGETEVVSRGLAGNKKYHHREKVPYNVHEHITMNFREHLYTQFGGSAGGSVAPPGSRRRNPFGEKESAIVSTSVAYNVRATYNGSSWNQKQAGVRIETHYGDWFVVDIRSTGGRTVETDPGGSYLVQPTLSQVTDPMRILRQTPESHGILIAMNDLDRVFRSKDEFKYNDDEKVYDRARKEGLGR